MVQDFEDNCYERTRKPANTDTNYFETNFEALKTEFSDADHAPSDSVAFQNWGDTTHKVKRFKSWDEMYWHGYWHGDSDQKIWMYRDDALDGWVIDSTPSDVVISIKGGTTYTTGGETGSAYGDWDGISDTDHFHKMFCTDPPVLAGAYTGGFDASGYWQNDAGKDWNSLTGSSNLWPGSEIYACAYGGIAFLGFPDGADRELWHDSSYGRFAYTDEGSSNWESTWRPKAVVGTIQYLDM